MVTKFAIYAPDLEVLMPPGESVNNPLGLIKSASIEKGDGGSYISNLGNKQWL